MIDVILCACAITFTLWWVLKVSYEVRFYRGHLEWFKEVTSREKFDNQIRTYVGLTAYKMRAHVKVEGDILHAKASIENLTYSRENFELLQEMVENYRSNENND